MPSRQPPYPRLALLAAAGLICAATLQAAPPPRAVELRDLGVAELENEKPERAEPHYRALVALLPKDPLGHANLAIALLRQQKNAEAMKSLEEALRLAPGRPELLAIKAEIEQWSGDLEAALATLASLLAEHGDDPELLYAGYLLATTSGLPAGEPLAEKSLAALARLRPDNLVVLLQLGQRQIRAGDRQGATATYLRVGELLWQAPAARGAYEPVKNALEKGDLPAAKVPAARLENVLKVNPMFRESLRELKKGIQGVPLERLAGEAAPAPFGEPQSLSFRGHPLDAAPAGGRALASADFDADGRPDIAWIKAAGELEIRLAAKGWAAGARFPAAELWDLRALDLDNDGHIDLFAHGAQRGAFWRGQGDGSFEDATTAFGLGAAGGRAAAAIDFDIEGDLDLALAGAGAGLGGNTVELWRNNLEGALERSGDKVLPKLQLDARALVASDLDRDGDLDLLLGHGQGLTWLDNLRQGRFVERPLGARAGAVVALASADFDNDGLVDLAYGGKGIGFLHNRGDGKFAAWPWRGLAAEGEEAADVMSLAAFDADNDGRLDLVSSGIGGISVLIQQQPGVFAPARLEEAPRLAARALPADLDGDGDLDLVVAGRQGLAWLENNEGNRQRWLAVRLRGLKEGNGKNNLFGLGSVVELRRGAAYQFREADGEVVHFGLGKNEQPGLLRVVWTNGVPQNRLAVAGNQSVTEEQVLKGSCPFLYAWDGKEFRFVTDLLWGAPIGLPAAPGVWVSSDPSELVRIDGLVVEDGKAKMRVTEELWEAAFFDHLRLWVVDHDEAVKAASNLRIVPGESQDQRVLALQDLRPMAAAWDGRGREVTKEMSVRDDIYADGYGKSPYQGVSPEWSFTFDLGEAPAAPLRLLLEGWIFPADASLNLAVAQRGDYPWLPPRLEVETAAGWQILMPKMGFPAGKTKAMVVDTPALPEGASRLRIVSSFWLHWDHLAWSPLQGEGEREIEAAAKVLPSKAELRFRGFSALARKAPNAPHDYDYGRTGNESPWLPFPGKYTRYGDVLELLEEPDDASVILAPGDEIDLEFDISELPPPAPGRKRTYFLESHGWDKDADRNTGEGERVEPLPFRGMKSYPYAPGENWPDDEFHRRYVEQWLTREVKAE
jgi:Flp pilus assembly protein TadD